MDRDERRSGRVAKLRMSSSKRPIVGFIAHLGTNHFLSLKNMYSLFRLGTIIYR